MTVIASPLGPMTFLIRFVVPVTFLSVSQVSNRKCWVTLNRVATTAPMDTELKLVLVYM